MNWSQIVEHRQRVLWLGAACFALAIFTAIAAFFHPNFGLTPIILALLGTQAMGSAPLLQRIADLQAAVEMKQLHIEQTVTGPVVIARPGSEFDIAMLSTAGKALRFHTSAKFEVTQK